MAALVMAHPIYSRKVYGWMQGVDAKADGFGITETIT